MSTHMSTQEYKNLLSQKSDKGKNKFNAKKTAADGFVFDSQAEAKRFFELKLLLRAFEIRELVVHPKYALEVNGVKIGEYEADFAYMCPQRGQVIEDVKGGDAQRGGKAKTLTALSRWKMSHLKAQYGYDVTVVVMG